MIQTIVSRVRWAAEWFSTLALFGMFLVTLAGVAMRYLFERPLSWSDELGMVMLLWAVFIGDAFVSRDSDHIAFDVLWDIGSPTVRRWMLILQGAFFSVLFLLALPTVIDYVLFLKRERTSSMEWRLDVVYACFAIYIAALAIRLAAKCYAAAGRNWRDHVADSDPTETANIIG